MIRHPLHSAAGRARPDLNRVADGIAASLRQFSISAQRCAQDDNGNDSRHLTGRQRAAAAVTELIANVENTAQRTRSQGAPRQPEFEKPPNSLGIPNPNTFTKPSNFDSFQRMVSDDPPASRPRAPHIIRGGFRGRGLGDAPRFARGGLPRVDGGAPRPEGMVGRPAGRPSRGGFRGNRDDRPRRGRGGRGRRRFGDKEGGRRFRRGEEEDEEATDLLSEPRVSSYIEGKELGETVEFAPSLTLESLAGWGPGLATSATPLAQGEAVLRQARILGGGNNFHSSHLVDPNVLRESYNNGMGIFIPPSDDGWKWVKNVFRDKEIVDGKKVFKERTLNTPAEVKTAVLDDVLLGKYEGPKHAESSDTLGVIASYVKRDGTWNVHAERGIQEKVRSLVHQPARQVAAKQAKA